VREALIQLESYKLVTCIRNKGTMVTKLSLTELRHLFALRRVLEGGSIALISGEVEPDIIKKLEVLLEKMTLQKDRVSNMRYNRLFHQLLCDTAQNPQMSELYANIFVKVERYLMYIYDTIGDFEKDLSAHREMLTLLKSQDYGTLQEKMNQHTLESETNFLEYLKAQGYQEPFDFDSLLPFKKS
jgi:DNA-binding GntR family transcriptional regulator